MSYGGNAVPAAILLLQMLVMPESPRWLGMRGKEAEMRRVLKPGGKLLVLEFSKVWEPLKKPYDVYSFSVLPWLGKKVANDADSYRYLAESIRMHPDQETLKQMMEQAGLDRVQYFNLTAGVAALHTGIKM